MKVPIAGFGEIWRFLKETLSTAGLIMPVKGCVNAHSVRMTAKEMNAALAEDGALSDHRVTDEGIWLDPVHVIRTAVQSLI